MSLLLWLALACEEPVSDAERYSTVLTQPAMPLNDALSRCARISRPDLRGDCALLAASRSPDPAAVCPDVPAGVWQEECFFVAAEAVNRAGDNRAAAALCGQAGRFQLDCAQHLWQTPVHQLIHSRGAAGFADALPQAELLYAAWSPVLAAQSDFEERFWAKFFGNGFEGQGGPISAAWCDPLPAQHQPACVAAAAAHLSRELGPAVEVPERLMIFCEHAEPGIAEVSAWLPSEPSPALDAAVAARQRDICTNAPGAPGRVGPGSCVAACVQQNMARAVPGDVIARDCEDACAR